MARRWSINGRFLTQSRTGVQRYACEIVKALDALVRESHPLTQGLEIDVLVPAGSIPDLKFSNIPIRAVGGAGGHLWEQFILPQNTPSGLLSLCNTGPVTASKHIVCVHDVNTRLYPQSYSLPFRALYRTLLPALGRTAHALATVSEYSATQLARCGIGTPEKISVISNGHEHALTWTPIHSDKTRAAAGPNTVLLIGSLAPHKNIGLVLGLADALAAAGLKIAVAGMIYSRIFKGTASRQKWNNVVWLGDVSDNALAALLIDCLCLAFPSFTEGFGLPPLEAMALGCPVVATDRASLPEVCGDAALYAAPTNPEAWLNHILRLRRDENLRARLAASGRARATIFSWRRSAELYLQLMARADGMAVDPPQDQPLSEKVQLLT